MRVRVALILTLLAAAGTGDGARAARAADDAENPGPVTPAAALPDARSNMPGPPDQVRQSAIYGIVGFGTPVGFFGVEGVHRFGSWFEVSAGLGGGLAAAGSGPQGPFHALQWSVMPRVRIGDDQLAVTFGVGVSGGNYGAIPPVQLDLDCEGCSSQPRSYPVRYVVWGNAEIGAEMWKRGFAFRAFSGFARGCTSDGCTGTADGAALAIPYFGVGFGYAF